MRFHLWLCHGRVVLRRAKQEHSEDHVFGFSVYWPIPHDHEEG